MPKAKKPADPQPQEYTPDPDAAAQSDADVLTKAQEIQKDTGRHQAAHDYLNKQADKVTGARDAARKQLHKKVKKGLKKAFQGGDTFQQEQGREQKQANETVHDQE